LSEQRHDERGAARDVRFAQDARHVMLDRPNGAPQLGGDFIVRSPTRDERHHIVLAWRELPSRRDGADLKR
jgi:hypothetical protein